MWFVAIAYLGMAITQVTLCRLLNIRDEGATFFFHYLLNVFEIIWFILVKLQEMESSFFIIIIWLSHFTIWARFHFFLLDICFKIHFDFTVEISHWNSLVDYWLHYLNKLIILNRWVYSLLSDLNVASQDIWIYFIFWRYFKISFDLFILLNRICQTNTVFLALALYFFDNTFCRNNLTWLRLG